MEPKKKKLGALAILAFKGRPKPKGEEDDEPTPDSAADVGGGGDDGGEDEDYGEHDASFDAFATAVGIPDDKREEAESALHQYIEACVRNAKAEG